MEKNLIDALEYIDPADCDYQEWINVGMALKHENYDVSVWAEWSSRDISRYHNGECEKKWRSFNGNTSPVTAGTIYQMAFENGYSPDRESYELDWDSEIGAKSDGVIVDRNWIEGREITEPVQWDPVKEITTYLETLFEPSENVGYNFRSFKNDKGKYTPADKGGYDRTAGELLQELSMCDGDIGAVFGDYDKEAGAWIRFNPLDGKGVKNANVTDFRYALVEADDMELDKQNAVIRELELPVAVLMYSGGRSIHAIVRIDATNSDEYRRRVDFLYSICKKNGLTLDQNNRNPSRLSRIPGVERAGKKQFIIDTNIGKASWDEWREWIEGINDDLPDIENIDSLWDNMPELSPPLIDGVLRQGHKMLIAGPSKAGKSYALIELSIALAEGIKWLGFQCSQGRVMYVNLELDRASCLHRFKDVYDELGLTPHSLKNIDIWNLRGRSVPMDKLAPKLIRRASKKNYAAIIIDPIYKVITGDENSADQMAAFCNQFDKVCNELECAVIYCHHHSKGAQGGKRSMDRASGSGVFARDPDALLDLIELEINDNLRTAEENKLTCDIAHKWLCRFNKETFVSDDDRLSPVQIMKTVRDNLQANTCRHVMEEIEAAKKKLYSRSAWRIEATLREFPKFAPVNVWFDYPVHRIDNDGVLKDIDPDEQWKQNFGKKKSPKDRKNDRRESIMATFESCNIDGKVTVQDMAELSGISEKTVRRHLKEHGGFWIDGNEVGLKEQGQTWDK